jgi:hypothetical protein
MICEKIGLRDYQVYDPKSYDLNRSFTYVLILGEYKGERPKAKKVWQLPTPDPELSREEKEKIFKSFMGIQKFLLTQNQPTEVKGQDIPRLKDLEEFLKEFRGQVMELKLPNGSIVGVYPDNERLEMKYPVENHASTLLNLARIKDIFDVTRVTVRDL